MGIHTIIGLKHLDEAKQRLMPNLSPGVRRELMVGMISAVVTQARAAALGPVLLASSEPSAPALAAALGVEVLSDAGLPWNDGLVHALHSLDPVPEAVLFLAGDLPLVTAAELRDLSAAAPLHGVVVARARDGGSNALLIRPAHALRPQFGVSRSAAAHAAQAAARGIGCVVVDIPGLALDVDTIDDARDAGLVPREVSGTGRALPRAPAAAPNRPRER